MSGFKTPGSLGIKVPNASTAQKQQYSISIQDPSKSYEAFKSDFKTSPEKILSNSKAKFNAPVDEKGKPSQFKVGAYIKIDIDGPLNNSYVKVIALKEGDDGSLNATFATVEGHLEKGVINFNLSKGKDGEINFKITSLSELDEVLVPKNLARKEQKKSWNEVLGNVLKATGGTVVSETTTTPPTSTPTYAKTIESNGSKEKPTGKK